MDETAFIPCTMRRQVAPSIFFRPLRSWHSGTFAGEGLTQVNGDGSGCVRPGVSKLCTPPLSVTHRVYWNSETDQSISAFLSYPNGLGSVDKYFWEIHPYNGDVGRFFTEEEMEEIVIRELTR